MDKITSVTYTLSKLRELMTDHNLTEHQAIILLATCFKIEWEFDLPSLLRLKQLNLLDDSNATTPERIFKDCEITQTTLDMTFESAPIVKVDTSVMVNNLEDKLVPDKYKTDEYITEVAKEFFKGDKTLARYFTIFRFILPHIDKTDNAKWNKHFGLVYSGATLWKNNVVLRKKFADVYMKKDIGLFLVGVYYAVRNSITEDYRCFMTTATRFMEDYQSWYEYAENSFNKKEKAPEKEDDRL